MVDWILLHVVAGKIGCGRLVRLDGDRNCKKGLKSSSKSLRCRDPISLLLGGGEDGDDVDDDGDDVDDDVMVLFCFRGDAMKIMPVGTVRAVLQTDGFSRRGQ